MGLVLGIPAEIVRNLNTPYVSACRRNPIIFLEIGFPSGIPESRIEVQLNKTTDFPVVKELLRLSTKKRGNNDGFLYSFKNCPISHVDSLHGMIMFGEKIKSEVWNNFKTSKHLQDHHVISGTVFESGSVFMLPNNLDSSQITSTFFITTQKQAIYEGIYVGNIIQGLVTLEHLVFEFGSNSGIPKKTPIIMDCGQA